MDYAIPASKIAALSLGEFVGMVADNPEQKIKLKMFHSQIQNDQDQIAIEEKSYKSIPVVASVTNEEINENYVRIREEIDRLFETELENILAR